MTGALLRGRRIASSEDGVTLVLALVFIMVLGVIISGLLALTGTNFATTRVTRSRTDALYSADGGADFALEQIRATAPSACPPALSSPPEINGLTPSIALSCTGGASAATGLLGAYSAIALGSSGITVDDSALKKQQTVALKYLGDVYSDDDIDGISGDGNSVTIQGNASRAGYSCAFDSTTNPIVTGSCLSHQGVPAVALTRPKVVVPSSTAPSPVQKSNCFMMYPGKYTTAPSFSGNKGYYLASGVYYFSDVGEIDLAGWIQGGAAGSTTPAMSDSFSSRCATAFANDSNAESQNPSGYSYTGTGVTIILGGSSVLVFKDASSTRVELYPRQPAAGSPDLAATAGVSVWGQDSTSAVTGSYDTLDEYDAFTTSGKLADVVTHGLTWLPDSKVQLSDLANDDADGVAQLIGGVVADAIAVYCEKSSGDLTAVIAGTTATVATPRRVTITSVVTPADGGATTTVKVVAVFPITAGGYPDIESWRKA